MTAETVVTLRGYSLGAGPDVYVDEDHLSFGAADMRSAEEPMPNRDGVLFGGPDLLGGRDLLIPVLIHTADVAEKHGKVLELILHAGDIGQAWRPTAADLTLTLTLAGARTFVVYGRPRPLTAESLALIDRGLVGAVLRFRMARPWLLDVQVIESVVSVVGGAEESGLGYPHGYPHGYGGEAAAGQVHHVAGGRIDTWPVVVLRGDPLLALTNPTLINDVTGQRLGLDTTINPGEQLVVDMYRQRVYATQLGADVMSADVSAVALVDRSATVRHPTDNDWWSVGPESTPVRLTGGGAGTAHILTRAAYTL